MAQTSYDETGQGLLIDLPQEEAAPSAPQKKSKIAHVETAFAESCDAVQHRFVFSLGDDLRLARQALGVSLADVSAHLRIRTEYLAALEGGALNNIPKGYASGFVRHYVAYLGEEAVGLSPAEAAVTVRDATAPQRTLGGEGGGRGTVGARLLGSPHGLIYGLSFLAFVTIYAVWYMATDRGFSAAELMDQPETSVAGSVEPDTTNGPAMAGLSGDRY